MTIEFVSTNQKAASRPREAMLTHLRRLCDAMARGTPVQLEGQLVEVVAAAREGDHFLVSFSDGSTWRLDLRATDMVRVA